MIKQLAWLAFLSLTATARAQPLNPYALTNPGSYSEFKVLPKGTYHEEILENVALPGGRKGYHSRYDGPRDKADCIYEVTPKGDLLRLKVTTPAGYIRLNPPLLSLPNLDRTPKWSSTSRLTFYSARYPKGYDMSLATQTGRVIGTEKVTVPAGTFQCLKVEVKFAREVGIQWYARGVGLVKMKADSGEYLLTRYRTGHPAVVGPSGVRSIIYP